MAKTKKKGLNETQLASLVGSKIQESVNYIGGNYTQYRIKAQQYYDGDPFGNEKKGESTVVDRVVHDVIESMMPSLMRIFASGDKYAFYEPVGPEDEPAAEQATDYVNYLWRKNNGYQIFLDWFKSALLYRAGVVKIYWDTEYEAKTYAYENLGTDEYEALNEADNVQIEQVVVYADPDIADQLQDQEIDPEQLPPELRRYDVELVETKDVGCVRIDVIEPENFLFDQWATNINTAQFLAHREQKTLSELREMGFEDSVLEGIEFTTADELHVQEKQERFEDTSDSGLVGSDDWSIDPSSRKTYVTEAYVRVDYDGDGIAELRKIIAAGENAYTILENEIVDSHPFALLTPIPVPNKMIGLSVADQTMDLQLIKSTLGRQALNSVYKTNYPRPVINDNVNMEDVLNPAPGHPIRAKNPTADLAWNKPNNITPELLQMMEYMDRIREDRTGVTRYNQGLEANTLNKTATGIGLISEKGEQRSELIARNFANTGVKQAFKRMLKLVTEHKSEPEVIRLRNKWVEINPGNWNPDFDVIVNVGLGTGDKDKELEKAMAYGNWLKEVVQFQGGAFGPLVTIENVYNFLEHLGDLLGQKPVNKFITNPALMPPQQQPQQQQTDPVAAQADSYLKAQMIKTQQEDKEAQMDAAQDQMEFNAKMALEREKMEREFALKEKELELKYAQMNVNLTRQDAQF